MTRMKRIHIIYISLLFCALALLSSCNKDNHGREVFIESCTDAGLYFDGTAAFVYDAGTCQVGFSEERKQFRVSDDDMKNFYILDVNKLPGGVDSSLKGTLTWTTDKDVRQRSGIDFKVVRVKDDMYWLWAGKGSVGVVVRMVR